ncbi:hypothetical protein [Thiocapsa rosea]|uniref:hypothetical protein n=1 Tax=Thiocapsa rosea TaxID=69360 RepID=UPI001FEC5BC5|nr:hypothetical protein [Thiocapsa rosea]
MRDTRLATRDVASALGYADVTAFSRAFRLSVLVGNHPGRMALGASAGLSVLSWELP